MKCLFSGQQKLMDHLGVPFTLALDILEAAEKQPFHERMI